MTDTPAVRIDRLRVVRGGNVVLPELSCDVAPGSVTGLLGPSGSGKSTLIRAIVGVQRIAGGSVEVLGRPAGAKELRARVGYMTQAPSVYGDLTVRENLRFFARVLGDRARRGRPRDRRGRPPAGGGPRRRAALGRPACARLARGRAARPS